VRPRAARATTPSQERVLLMQRAGGNRATAAALARRRVSGPVLQRAAVHFWDFARKAIDPWPPTTTTDKDMLLAGWLLDQHIVELVDLISQSRIASTVVENVQLLGKAGLTLDDVQEFLKRHGAPMGEDPKNVNVWLQSFVKTWPAALTQEVSTRSQHVGGKAGSEISWLGLTPWGAGLGVELKMAPGPIPKGSGATGEPVWMKTVEQHTDGGSTTIYVRGHLLNYDLGGPGLDYNMVPITGKPAKNLTGANDANGEHYWAVEQKAKDTLKAVQSGAFKSGYYAVKPSYTRASRPGTGSMGAAAATFQKILVDAVHFDAKTRLTNLPQLAIDFSTMDPGKTLPPMSPPEQALALAQHASRVREEGAPYGILLKSNDPVAKAIEAQIDAGILNASAGGKPGAYTLRTLNYLVSENSRVWEFEDAYVPQHLDITLSWVDGTGTGQGGVLPAVPVNLPTDPGGPHFRSMKSSEIS
jgi:hypothetical protein